MFPVPGLPYFLKAAAVFGAILAIALPRRREHHPFPRFGAANQITIGRAALVSLVAAFVGEPHTVGALAAVLAMGLIATILDGVDGWAARRQRLESAFGARFDQEIDALLIQALSILAWRYDKAGAWVLASGLTRYVFVGAGRLWPWLRGSLPGTARGKAVCVVQIAGLLVALLPAVRRPASSIVAAASLAALWYSFFVDTRSLWQRRLDR